MLRRTLVAALTGALTIAPSISSASDATGAPSLRTLVAPGAKVVRVAKGLYFAEGPVWLPKQGLIVSDVLGNDLVAIDAAGRQRTFRKPSNTANGHALDNAGRIVEAESGKAGGHRGAIVRLAADGSPTILVDAFHGKRFNAPNDLTVKRDGTIWFTDPDLEDAATSAGIGFKGVFRFDPRTKSVTAVLKTLGQPNGIAFSPDEKTLYVSDSNTGTLIAYPVARDGTLGHPRTLGPGCDGIGVDEYGDIWGATCGTTIAVTSPSGRRIGEITVPGETTNVAWGGADDKTLFITTQEGDVFSLALTVHGTR